VQDDASATCTKALRVLPSRFSRWYDAAKAAACAA
jgi:hypothetical protein